MYILPTNKPLQSDFCISFYVGYFHSKLKKEIPFIIACNDPGFDHTISQLTAFGRQCKIITDNIVDNVLILLNNKT